MEIVDDWMRHCYADPVQADDRPGKPVPADPVAAGHPNFEMVGLELRIVVGPAGRRIERLDHHIDGASMQP